MALVVHLEVFNLPELLQLVGTRVGILDILESPVAAHMSLGVSNGRVQQFARNGVEITDSSEMVKILGKVASYPGGMASFRTSRSRSVGQGFPLDVLAMKVAIAADEIRQSRGLPKIALAGA